MSTFGEPIDLAALPLEEQYRFYREVLKMTDEQASLAVTFSAGLTTGDAPDSFGSIDDWIDSLDPPDSWDALQAEVE